ncbi:MAG: hypothetical protein WCI72_00830 [archaeon]
MNQKRGSTNLNKRGSHRDPRQIFSLDKRGQVTIFIIIAILIVAIILFYFYYLGPTVFSTNAKKPYLERCIESGLAPQIEKLSLAAGVVNPTFTSQYLDENYTFICYTNEYYKPCVVQQPFLKDSFEKALAAAMKPKIQECYDGAIAELQAQGNEITPGTIKTNLSIDPDGVSIKINAPTVRSADGASSFSKSIDVNVYSDLYTVIMVANSILQFESSYGDSDVSSFMFYYPDLKIEKIRRDDSVKLYIITDKNDIKYRFASRSYAWPPGYGNTYD